MRQYSSYCRFYFGNNTMYDAMTCSKTLHHSRVERICEDKARNKCFNAITTGSCEASLVHGMIQCRLIAS